MILAKAKIAVNALRSRFPNTFRGKETSSQYNFSDKTTPDGLALFARELRDALFSLTLKVDVDGYLREWSLDLDGDKIRAQTEADASFDAMIEIADGEDIDLEILLAALAASISGGRSIELSLHISLTKREITNALESEYQCVIQKVVVFLFTDEFIRNIKDTSVSLSVFEEDYCRSGERTTIILVDYDDCLSGDLLVISGPGPEDLVKEWVCAPLTGEIRTKTRESLLFRKSQSLGDFRTKWMTPDFFALGARRSANNVPAETILEQLKPFQALLSILFLADFVENEEDGFRVEYRGRGVTSLPGVNRSSLIAQQSHLDSVYDLYVYAYQELRTDKLEVAQQLLSLMAASLESLCARSGEIKEATKQTYSGVLREKVSEYFAAVEKLEDRLKTAVGESAQSALGLTRSVSEDLYKIAGVIAGAVVAALIKPDLSRWVGFGASLVVAAYLTLVIFYHLATLETAFGLSMAQHRRYINSFEDIVGPEKTRDFLNDEHLERSIALLMSKRILAERIYGGLLVLSLLVAFALISGIAVERIRDWL